MGKLMKTYNDGSSDCRVTDYGVNIFIWRPSELGSLAECVVAVYGKSSTCLCKIIVPICYEELLHFYCSNKVDLLKQSRFKLILQLKVSAVYT